jgi:hypothetical protein
VGSCVEIDVDGALHAQDGARRASHASEIASVFRRLIGGRDGMSDEAVAASLDRYEVRAPVRRMLALSSSMSQRAFRDELEALQLPRPEARVVGDVVRALFAPRVRLEAELDEQVATLDDHARNALIQRAIRVA